mmetsp:Transcript_50105/g.162196  ORF Transcript_50105/g.162196 Transcript_50105/m.162196 type:complete len:442 (+) Transcript_50105:674-1999(+)
MRTASSSLGKHAQKLSEPNISKASSSQSRACEWMSNSKPTAPPSFWLAACPPKPRPRGLAFTDSLVLYICGKAIAGPLKPLSKSNAFFLASPAPLPLPLEPPPPEDGPSTFDDDGPAPSVVLPLLPPPPPPAMPQPRREATEPSRRPTTARPPPTEATSTLGRPSASGANTSAEQATVSELSQALAEFSLSRCAYWQKPCCVCRSAAAKAARAPRSPPCSRPRKQTTRSRAEFSATYSAPPTPRRPAARPAKAATAEMPPCALSSTAAFSMGLAEEPVEKPTWQRHVKSSRQQTCFAQALPSSSMTGTYVTGVPGSSGAGSSERPLSVSPSSTWLRCKNKSWAACSSLPPEGPPSSPSPAHGATNPKPLARLNHRTRPKSLGTPSLPSSPRPADRASATAAAVVPPPAAEGALGVEELASRAKPEGAEGSFTNRAPLGVWK